MEEFKDNHNSERKFQKTRTSFRPGQKQNRPNRHRDRQKGMVTAFVQGKGQNAALKWLMDSRTPVSVFLITGVKFEGLVSAFDAFTISITDVKRHQQMIYKDKISTITIKRPEGAAVSHRSGMHKDDISEPGVSRPLRGDSQGSSDDGVTLPEHHVPYTGSM
ncbi:MAG: RNA chaperone Hfq [Succinivibrio sp.]